MRALSCNTAATGKILGNRLYKKHTMVRKSNLAKSHVDLVIGVKNSWDYFNWKYSQVQLCNEYNN